MSTDFQIIFDHGCKRVPQLMPKATYAVYEWIAEGYDPEKDVIPAIDSATEKTRQPIKSWSYFTGWIKKHHETRIKLAAQPKVQSQAEKDASKAKNIKWHQDRGISSLQVGPQDYEWLQRYEKEHGPIAI